MKSLKSLVGSAAVATALLSVGVSSAAAAPATWNLPNGTTNVKVGGTVTVSGVGSTTCTFAPGFPSGLGKAHTSATQGYLELNHGFPTSATCANGRSLSLSMVLQGEKNGAAFSMTNIVTGTSARSPLYDPSDPNSWYQSGAFTAPFTNGSGATPSKITFNNTTVSQGASTVILTGSLNVTKWDGSLLTLK